MNIKSINQIYQVYKNTSIAKAEKTEKASNVKDAVNISPEAKEFQTAFTSAMKAEDVREDLVSDIKQRIDDKDYVDTDALVDKIINKK
ncbi:MAG: hypothetical protein A2Y22_05580 [Clostridiales bacterium GWD2_32_59]|nr:MAG: hypothetical protein A2Y22_05580 [Clostridiales bacterium GWD2_32_59]